MCFDGLLNGRQGIVVVFLTVVLIKCCYVLLLFWRCCLDLYCKQKLAEKIYGFYVLGCAYFTRFYIWYISRLSVQICLRVGLSVVIVPLVDGPASSGLPLYDVHGLDHVLSRLDRGLYGYLWAPQG